MKNNLHHKIALAGSFFLALSVESQSINEVAHNNPSNEKTYVVTDSVRNGARWNFLRTLDQRNGAFSPIIFRLLNYNELQPPQGAPSNIPVNGVAAIALDQKNKRLYYTPMLTDKLYYLDLRTMKRYLVTNHFTGLMPKAPDQSNIVTRMVIGDDNKGYALTNDGRHLIRFRINNNSNNAVTDLGSLVDAPGNRESVHNACSSFGGDIIADDDDHLYLFTTANHVFKIKIQTKVARYIGTVTNLPAHFTTSSAAVDKSGEKITLVSSADSSDVYTVKLKTLVAGRLHANRSWFSADLANDNILEDEDRHGHHHRTVINANPENDNVQMFPNPVTAKEFKIRFMDVKAGVYMISVVNVDGNAVVSKSVNTGGKDNIVSIQLPALLSSGIYVVRIMDDQNKLFYSGKIFVQ